MKIGIIGAGYVGRAVGRLAVEAGHDVMLSNSRGPQSLFSTGNITGCKVGTVDEAVNFGEIILVAIPLGAYQSVPVEPLAGKIVIDANNYYPGRDGQIAALDRHETTTSEMLASHLPRARVIKGFNAVRMGVLEDKGRPAGAADRQALPLAGDDAEGKAVVAALYEAFGFDAVDVGALSEGWRFEEGRPAYCTELNRAELLQALAATDRVAA